MTPDEIRASIQPKSDQLNAEDLIAGPMIVTVISVTKGSAEQPFDIRISEDRRYFRPCKTMRRLLVFAWGVDASAWKGRKMRLVHDPDVKFGGVAVGGIRISHLSHISQRASFQLSVTRGKRAPVTADPLKDCSVVPPSDVSTPASLGDEPPSQTPSDAGPSILPPQTTPSPDTGAGDFLQALLEDPVRKKWEVWRDNLLATLGNGTWEALDAVNKKIAKNMAIIPDDIREQLSAAVHETHSRLVEKIGGEK